MIVLYILDLALLNVGVTELYVYMGSWSEEIPPLSPISFHAEAIFATENVIFWSLIY